MKLGTLKSTNAMGMLYAVPVAHAACMYCPAPGQCVMLALSCNALSSAPGACFTLGPLMFQPVDHIQTQAGRAWLVQGEKRTPIASDSMHASVSRIIEKYPAGKSNDPKIQKERTLALEALFKAPDSGAVSHDLLLRISGEVGLSLR